MNDPETDSSSLPSLQPPGIAPLPGPLNSLAIRAGRLPWWLIILAIGLVVSLYGILTTPEYLRALVFTTDDPRLSTTDLQVVTYRVNINGQVQRISGTVVTQAPNGQAQNDQQIVIRTVDPQVTVVDRSQVSDLQRNSGTVTATIPPKDYEGAFYTEGATDYNIRLDSGQIVSVKKVDVRSTEKRTPEGCQADTRGSCRMSVTVPGSQISGKLLSETPASLTIQTVTPEYVTFPRSDIQDVISERTGTCALNNLGSCQEGIFLTAFLAVIAYVLALIIGLLIALMRISSQPVLRNIAVLYVEVVRGIPILVILLIFYFGIGPWIRDNLSIPMPEVQRAILGLAFAYGSFLAEIFRAGIQSISRGQMEAARSLGMTYFQAMRYIILPQAIRVVLPPLGNDFIAMLKDTSLVAFISLEEMTQRASLLNGRTYLPFPAFLTIAVLYLIMTLFLSFIVRAIEARTRLPA